MFAQPVLKELACRLDHERCLVQSKPSLVAKPKLESLATDSLSKLGPQRCHDFLIVRGHFLQAPSAQTSGGKDWAVMASIVANIARWIVRIEGKRRVRFRAAPFEM